MALKVAVVGLGRMGERHVAAAVGLGHKIVALCDMNQERLQAVSEKFSLSRDVWQQEVAMALEARPDLFIIATTAPVHHAFTVAAARAGVPFILCEKPMATSLQQCHEMLEICKQKGSLLAINHQSRFLEQFLVPKKICESPDMGGLVHMSVNSGNSGLAMLGTHQFEMFRLMMGEPVQEVSAWIEDTQVANPRGAQFQDHGGLVVARARSGRFMTFSAGTQAGHGLTVNYVCQKGQVFVDVLSGDVRVTRRQNEHLHLPSTQYAMPSVLESLKIPPPDLIKATQSVINAMVTGKNYPSGEDGMHAIACVVAAHVSGEKQHTSVPVDVASLPGDKLFAWA